MFLLNIPLICFIVINSISVMESTPTREKPIRKTVVPESPRVKPPVSPPKQLTPTLTYDNSVGITKTKKSRLIDDDNDNLYTKISLNNLSDKSDSSESSDNEKESESPPTPPPPISKSPTLKRYRKRHKTLSKTKSPEDDMIKLTESDEISGVIKSQIVDLSKSMIDDLSTNKKRNVKKGAAIGISSLIILLVLVVVIVVLKKI